MTHGLDQAILHTPCCLYTDKIMATYPETHVILNTRDVEGWHQSMLATVFCFFDRPSWTILRYTDRMAAELCEFDRAP